MNKKRILLGIFLSLLWIVAFPFIFFTLYLTGMDGVLGFGILGTLTLAYILFVIYLVKK